MGVGCRRQEIVMQVIASDFWDGANLPLSRLPKKESVGGLIQQRHSHGQDF